MDDQPPPSPKDAKVEEVDIVRCHSCEKKLLPVFQKQEPSDKDHYQYDNALVLSFEGGYGMFIDPFPGDYPVDYEKGFISPSNGEIRIIICHDCSHKLCEDNPWIDKLIKPFTSHSHSYEEDWTDHKGWDLPHKKEEIDGEGNVSTSNEDSLGA